MGCHAASSFIRSLNILHRLRLFFSFSAHHYSWCPHCQHFRKHYNDFAKQMKEIAKNNNIKLDVYAISCVPHKPICRDKDIHGYPRIKLFVGDNVEDDDGIEINHGSLHAFKVLQLLYEKGRGTEHRSRRRVLDSENERRHILRCLSFLSLCNAERYFCGQRSARRKSKKSVWELDRALEKRTPTFLAPPGHDFRDFQQRDNGFGLGREPLGNCEQISATKKDLEHFLFTRRSNNGIHLWAVAALSYCYRYVHNLITVAFMFVQLDFVLMRSSLTCSKQLEQWNGMLPT